MVVYISMGFGNPYGDVYDEAIVFEWVEKLAGLGIGIISLADTVGLADALQIEKMTSYLVSRLPAVEFGVHLHSTPENWKEKLDAALRAGCLRFDGAINGIGGCPMAGDDLVGNMNTIQMLPYFREKGLMGYINNEALDHSIQLAGEVFI